MIKGSKYQRKHLQDAVKEVLREKFMAINAYTNKKETFQINNLTLYLKCLGKEEQTNPKVSRRKEIIKIITEISEMEARIY